MAFHITYILAYLLVLFVSLFTMISPRYHSDNISPTGHNAPKYSPAQSDPAMRTGVNRVQRARVTFSYKPVNNDELKLEVCCLFVCLFVICYLVHSCHNTIFNFVKTH